MFLDRAAVGGYSDTEMTKVVLSLFSESAHSTFFGRNLFIGIGWLTEAKNK
jgi:hypothetical protein